MTDQVVNTNTDFALKPKEFTWADHSFIGWNTSADGTLTLEGGVELQVSDNGFEWTDYEAPTRKKYMKTK